MNGLKALARHLVVAGIRLLDAVAARTARHELAICAIFREEAPFLDEWLRFHHGVGVTQFYLYDNFSTDGFRAVLAPWIDKGLVTLVDWPRPVGQLSAYAHCVRANRLRARRIAFIDIDEFLFCPEQTDIRPVLAAYDRHPGLLVYGLFFGSGGHRERPAAGVTEAYVRRAPVETACSAKTIANPRHIRSFTDVHVFRYWTGEAVDTDRRTLAEGRPAPVFDLLRFNHYWSRSIADLHQKVARGDASTPNRRELDWHLAYEVGLNEIDDRTIAPVAAAVLGDRPVSSFALPSASPSP